LTKWHDNNGHFVYDSDGTIIASEEQIRQQDHREKEYICKFCRYTLCKLVDYSGQNISWYCPNCKVTTYDTEDLRSESHLEMSEGPITEPAASIIPEPQLKRKKKELKGGLKALQDKGVHVTSYSESKG
jgi:hypothetical protein